MSGLAGIAALLGYLTAAAFVALALWLPGYVVGALFLRSLGLEERIALSFGVSTALFGGVGLAVYASGVKFAPAAGAATALILLVSAVMFVKGRMHRELQKADKFPLFIMALIFTFSILYVALPGDTRETQDADTYYSVKAPYLPGDTYIPYRVAQFMMNGMDIDKETFYADWFFSDRTPLMGAVAADFEALLGQRPPAEFLWQLDDASWRLIDREGYWLYRLVASLLSVMWLLPAYLLAERFFKRQVARASTLFMAVNSFLLVNTFYTWPKLMMTYFLLFAFLWVASNRHYVAAGASLALAYLSHPVAALFVAGAFAYVVAQTRLSRETLRRWGALAGGALLLASPWAYWTTFVYRHPSRMMTYPIGYIITDPLKASEEVRHALTLFLKRPIGSILLDRFTVFADTVAAASFLSKVSRAVSGATQGVRPAEVVKQLHKVGVMFYYGALPGMLGVSLWVFVCYGLMARVKTKWPYVVSFLAVPFVCVLAFWGIWPRAVGMDVLQPMVPLLVPFGVYTLWLTGRKWLIAAVAVLAAFEYAAVIWLAIGFFKLQHLALEGTPATFAVAALLIAWNIALAYVFWRVLGEFHESREVV